MATTFIPLRLVITGFCGPGQLGYKMVHEFHNFPGVFGWEHPDDMAEESFSVYDHPTVYIFKKGRKCSRGQNYQNAELWTITSRALTATA